LGFDEPPLAKDYHNVFVDDFIDGKKYTFRSKLEHKLAWYLEVLRCGGQIKSWEYETHKFTFADSSWLVDFTIRNNDDTFEYFEAKGHVERDTKRKLQLVAKYYPQAQITMVLSRKQDVKKLGVRATACCKRVCTLSELTRGIV
jgi:hypothetical protein